MLPVSSEPLLVNSMEIDNYSILNLPSYEVHDPIYIGSNDDFVAQGWPGNGAKENPYVIENLNISLPIISCIFITNVDCFFIIKNCYLDGNNTDYKIGITLEYTKNGIIENNTISRCQSAIDLETCEDILIYNNELCDNGRGLSTQRGMNCIICYNAFCNADNLRGFLEVHTYHHNYYNDYGGHDNNGDGIGDMPHVFRWSYDLYPLMSWPCVELGPVVVLPRNTTHGNITYEIQGPIHIWGENVYGVDFFELKGFPGEGSKENPIIIENLLILGTFDNGASISLKRTTKHVIIRNCYLEFGCIMASGAGNMTISDNIVNRTGGTGIWTGTGCTNVTVCNNRIYNTRFGIMSMGNNNITICNNTVITYGASNSEMCFGIRGENVSVCNNTFIGGYYGIRAYSSSINYSIIMVLCLVDVIIL
jgi:parallel beta-helix repeat protein